MFSKRKLAETHYFLEGLRSEQEPAVFYFKLSAFLSASHSVMDILLYDFAEKHGLGLTRDDWLDTKTFELIAKSHNIKEELEFSNWRREKLNQLSDNPIWNMRRFNAHRGYPKVSQETVIEELPLSGAVVLSGISSSDPGDSRRATPAAQTGTIVVFGTPAVETTTKEIRTRNVFRLDEAASREVSEVCQELYDELAAIVDEAQRRFWDGSSE